MLTVFTFLHNRLVSLTFYPFEELINVPSASVVGDVVLNLVYSLSSLSVSQLCFLCLCSFFHPAQFMSLFLTYTQLSVPALSLSLALSGGGGGLLQTAVGGQNHSRQQEGEGSLSGALKGRLAGSSCAQLREPFN